MYCGLCIRRVYAVKNHLHTCLLGPVVPPCLASLWNPERKHRKTHTYKTQNECSRYLLEFMEGMTALWGWTHPVSWGTWWSWRSLFPSRPLLDKKNTFLSTKFQKTPSIYLVSQSDCQNCISIILNTINSMARVKTGTLLIKCTFRKKIVHIFGAMLTGTKL